MVTRVRLLVLAVGLLLMTACAPAGPAPASPSASPGPLRGRGEFTFVPEDGRPIRVFFGAGQDDLRQAQIVVVMHGVNRNAADYRDSWLPHIDGRPVLVVAPEFSDADFPGSNGYNLGGLRRSGRERTDGPPGAFGYIEPLFRDVVRRIGGGQDRFDLFGHSAGAQFVHRYVEFVPDAPVGRAVAANAGWYTMPEATARFPYGMKDAPEADPRGFLNRELVVLLGADDIESENLRSDRQAMDQGSTRLDRGLAFYASARRAASEAGASLRWSLIVVPGIEHDHEAMAGVAARILLPSP